MPIAAQAQPGVEHRQHRYLDNHVEDFLQPTRRRERRMRGFKSPGQAQRFLAAAYRQASDSSHVGVQIVLGCAAHLFAGYPQPLSSASAAFRSAVSKPSVNRSYTGASNPRASAVRSC
jgi:hypothetical protein